MTRPRTSGVSAAQPALKPSPASTDPGQPSHRAAIRALNGAAAHLSTWLDLARPSRAEIDVALAEARLAADDLAARLLAARERAP